MCSGYRGKHVRSCYVRAGAGGTPEAGRRDHQAGGRHSFHPGPLSRAIRLCFSVAHVVFVFFATLLYYSQLFRVCVCSLSESYGHRDTHTLAVHVHEIFVWSRVGGLVVAIFVLSCTRSFSEETLTRSFFGPTVFARIWILFSISLLRDG